MKKELQIKDRLYHSEAKEFYLAQDKDECSIGFIRIGDDNLSSKARLYTADAVYLIAYNFNDLESCFYVERIA